LKLARDGEEDGVLGIYAEVTAEVEGAIDGDVVVGAVWIKGLCCEELGRAERSTESCTPLYLLNSFSSSLEDGGVAGGTASLAFMYDCRATSRRRCLSRYRFASRELGGGRDSFFSDYTSAIGSGTYVAPVTLTNSLTSLSFLELRDCRRWRR